MSILIYFAASFCVILILAVILSLLPLPKWKQKKEDEKKPGEVKKPEKSKITEIIKISAAGAVFLILLYALVPEFIVKHHKEIIILVAAMIAGSVLLGIKQDWEKSSTRKILRAHYAVFSVILILGVFYKIPEVRSWIEDFQPKPALQPQAAEAPTAIKTLKFILKPGEEKECIIPADQEDEASMKGKVDCLIPLGYWARMHSVEDVRMSSWDNRELKGRHWLGNQITDAHFTLSSFEKNKDAIVKIILRPK